jgi:hypothetical protein
MDIDMCRFSRVLTSVMSAAFLNSMLRGSCKLWDDRLININYWGFRSCGYLNIQHLLSSRWKMIFSSLIGSAKRVASGLAIIFTLARACLCLY